MRTSVVIFLWLACCLQAHGATFEDVVYLPKDRVERLTIVTPEGPGPFPCVLVVPGGGWGKLVGLGNHKKTNAPWLAKNGYVGVVVEYHVSGSEDGPLAGAFAIPHALYDLQTAIRFMRANAAEYKVDVDRVGAIGFSAGGWSSSLVGYARPGFTYQVKGKGTPWTFDRKDLPYSDRSCELQAVVLSSGNRDMKVLTKDAKHTRPIPTLLICGEGEYKKFAGKNKAAMDQLFATAEIEFTHGPVIGGKHAPPITSGKRGKPSKVRMTDGSEQPTSEVVLGFLARHLTKQ